MNSSEIYINGTYIKNNPDWGSKDAACKAKIISQLDFLVFHIPLDLACRTILKSHVLMQQRNAVGHIHYFTREMVQWALKDKGYTISDWMYTKPIIDVYPPDSFKRRVKKYCVIFLSLSTKILVQNYGEVFQ